MKYGVFSDVHGSLSNLLAVQSRLSRIEVVHQLFLGDLLANGNTATEDTLVNLVRADRSITSVRGNHDERTFLQAEGELVRGRAISQENLGWLDSLPSWISIGELIAFHSSLRMPNRYLFGEDDILNEYKYISDRIGRFRIHLFGHTHEKRVFRYVPEKDEFVRMHARQQIHFRAGKVYFINPGALCTYAIGGPQYCIIDTTRAVYCPQTLAG